MGFFRKSLTEVVVCKLCAKGMSTAAECTDCGVVCCLDCISDHGCEVVVTPVEEPAWMKAERLKRDEQDAAKRRAGSGRRSSSLSDSAGL